MQKWMAMVLLLALATPARAEVDRAELGGGLFGYATGNPDTSMQDRYIVESASNPEKVFASQKIKRSGGMWELGSGPA